MPPREFDAPISPSSRWVRVTPRLRIRFHRPGAFRLDRTFLASHILSFREKNFGLAAPELSLILVSLASIGGGTLAEALEWQKRHSNGQAMRRLRRCRETLIGGLHCGHIEILDTNEGVRDTTYVRLFDGCACLCCYRLPPRSRQRRTLDAAARKLIISVEIDGELESNIAGTGKRVTVPDAGFSVVLPAEWERQDILGQVIVYAPGVGFRARISISASDANDQPDSGCEQSVLDAIDVFRHMLETSYSKSRFKKPHAIESAGRRGFCLEWTGTLARNGVRTQGRAVVLPHKRGGVFAMYQSQGGRPFRNFEPAFDQVLRSIRWIRKAAPS